MKTEAKRMVRRAKNVKKDVNSKPQRFWARSNGRRSKDSMNHIHDDNGQVLVDDMEVIER